MPIDYQVFQPRPLQAFDVASAFTDLAKSKQGWQKLKDDRQHDADANSQFAATFAADRSKLEYDNQVKRFQERLKAAEALRAAQQGNDMAAVEAQGPGLQEMGGTYEKSQGTGGLPAYEIRSGGAPTLGALDIQGAHRDIFGGGNGPPTPGQGGGMYSEVSPFGPRSQQPPGKNPMDPPSMPGLSAAAAGPLPSAGPPQEPQPEQLGGPPMDAPTDAPQAPASGAQPQELTGPNPLNPPMFSPYRINMADVTARNQAQLQPYLEGMQNAVPGRFSDRMRSFSEGANALGRPPEVTLAQTQPQFEQIASLWRGEMAAEAADARLQQSGERAELVRDQREEDRARAFTKTIVDNDNLKKTKDKLIASAGVESLLEAATRNPTVANELISQLYRMNNVGVMNDKDYSNARQGVVSWHQAVKNFTVEKLLAERGGLNPDTTRDMKEYLDIALRQHRQTMAAARDKVYAVYKGARSESARHGYADGMRGFFPEEYLPPEIRNPDGSDSDASYSRSPEAAEPSPVPGNDLGRSPLPHTLDGGPKVSPNGVPLVRGSRVPPKPPRRPMKTPTEAELDSASEDELMQMLKNAAGER